MTTFKHQTPAAADTRNKKYQCGWCKFKAIFSATILRHHERKHPGLELDIIVPKQPGRPLTSPDKDIQVVDITSSSDDNVCYHNNMFDDLDLPRSTTNIPSAEDKTNSPITKPKSKRKRNSMSKKALINSCKMKTIKIHCDDILTSGAWYIHKLMDKFALSKVCFDALAPHEFLGFTAKFKHQLKYIDSKKPYAAAKDLQGVADADIAYLF